MTFETTGFKRFGSKGFRTWGRRVGHRRTVANAFAVTPSRVDEAPDELDRIVRILGDPKTADRVYKLKRRYPYGTLPELVVLDWLERMQIAYKYQVSAFGGRRNRGGLVPDFLVPNQGKAMVWLVQGEYWHSTGRKGWEDHTAKLRLTGRWVDGYQVRQVLELWESDLYGGRADQTLRLAMAGIEIRR